MALVCTHCRQSATNHAHYVSIRIHIGHSRSTLLHNYVNQRKCKHETVRFVRHKIVRKDNLKVAERRRTVLSVSKLFLQCRELSTVV